MYNLPLVPVDILLPNEDISHELWSVVACDQYSSEREYWERVKNKVGESPSTLKLIIPEVYLEEIDESSEIKKIRQMMESYISEGIFREVKNSFIYVERTQSDGQVRKGLVGALDLETYDYTTSSTSDRNDDTNLAAVLASEGTALDRLPPRIRVRKAASLELPHIMVLIADEGETVIEPLEKKLKELEPLYDFELMEGGGHLRGTRISDENMEDVVGALSSLHEKKMSQNPPQCLMIVGDGNHSLAAAKNYWDELKRNISQNEADVHPARYALVEINNLYDSVISFEPIHRVVFDVDVDMLASKIIKGMSEISALNSEDENINIIAGSEEYNLKIMSSHGELSVTVNAFSASEVIEKVQVLLDEYIDRFGGRIDYIHEEDILIDLVRDEKCMGIIFSPISKQEFLDTVALRKILPRKSFSIGHAQDKRFYMECRGIQVREES